MRKTLTYTKWLEAAYQEFAHCGPEFSLKSLALKANLPRATLYYHFDSKEHLIDELLKKHHEIAEAFINELKTNLKNLLPDLYCILYSYRMAAMFQQQLLRNCHYEEYMKMYNIINYQAVIVILPHIRDYFGFKQTDQEVIELYLTLTDAWYSKVNFTQCNAESLQALALCLMDNVQCIVK